MDRYNLEPLQNRPLEACIYIAAYPDIFRCINMDNLKGPTPLNWYYNHLENKSGDHYPNLLSGTSETVVIIGLALYHDDSIPLRSHLTRVSETEYTELVNEAFKLILDRSIIIHQ